MGDDVKWLWKSTTTESSNEPFTTCYRLTLATAKPLQEEDIIQTLKHLFRKVPSLRVCLGERDGESWLREMPKEIIDFETTTDDENKVIDQLQDYEYNKTTGPLWCIKLKAGKTIPLAEYPHVYDLFYGINHLITDGTSNMMIIGFLSQLLDDVMAGRPIDDSEQLATFISDEKTENLKEKHLAALQANPKLMSTLTEEYQALQNKCSLFRNLFKEEEEIEPKTGRLTIDFDSDTTSSFIKRCRSEGVTVNSALTAIANIAIKDLLEEKGLLQDSYCIRSEHVINARRFWERDSSHYLGCHILPFTTISMETPCNVRHNLWNYIRQVDEELKKKIKTDKRFQKEAISMLNPDAFSFHFDFTMSNMGDVTKLVRGTEENVRVIHVLRSVGLHTTLVNVTHLIHTFKGRLFYMLLYNTSLVNPKTARKLFQFIVDTFHALALQ